MDTVLSFLSQFKYLAMFAILFMCGLGLPVPEEVTLIGSGLLVGWGEADFLFASLACVLGILAGDTIIFGMGYFYGRSFLRSRPMRILLSPRRQAKVARFFQKHGSKAVFFARFFAGVRIGVYAYAGSQRFNWLRFWFFDLCGALISGPTSILVGKWAAKTFADNKDEAVKKAIEIGHRAGHWILAGAILLIAAVIVVHRLRRRQRPAAPPSLANGVGKTLPFISKAETVKENVQ